MLKHPFKDYRKEFPILEEKIQLSSCSQSALHKSVKNSVLEYIQTLEHNGMEWHQWMEKIDESRRLFAQLIHADEDEIAITSSVSTAISAIATALDYKDRSKVAITDLDFPTVGNVWLAQERVGANISFISSEQLTLPVEYYDKYIDEETLITSIPHVTYYNGYKQDLKKVADIVHRKGSYLLVDAYQSAGTTKINVKEMNIDFLVTGLQKYLLGIPGIAFLYIKRDIAEKMQPRVTGWFGQKQPFAFDIQSRDYANAARRFDTGTQPMINGYAAVAALKLIKQVGIDNIESYLSSLSKFAIEYAQEKNLSIKSPLDIRNKGASTAIYVPNASEIEQKMKEKGIIVSARNDVIRIAPHFYNNVEDIKIALDTLKALV